MPNDQGIAIEIVFKCPALGLETPGQAIITVDSIIGDDPELWKERNSVMARTMTAVHDLHLRKMAVMLREFRNEFVTTPSAEEGAPPPLTEEEKAKLEKLFGREGE